MKRALAIVVVAGCGAPTESAPPVPAAPPVDDVLRAKPGVDLEGPIQMPDRSGPVHVTSAAPVDLASDRAIVHVSVPVVPRGGATSFSFADDRSGWVARIPDTVQLPAVAYGAGKVFVSGGFESQAFYALDASSGRVAWATADLHDPGPTAAVYDDGHVVFNTESCTLFALDARTGRVQWSRVIGSVTLAQTAVAGGLVFAAHPDLTSSGYELTAYRITDGEPVWTHVITNELLAAPVVSGDSVYASTADGSTYRLRRTTGALVWSEALEATTAPWIAGDELYVSRMRHGKEQQLVVSAATGKMIRALETSAG
ncbi:MAG TPA: PQQ-binding-like beta-propeller repeat protein, partial [Kofleriaceae bacterium]|nr:PQQ-binding-like beta-propeller repeat protein [Kofleriaceae bacterium]